MSRRMQKHKRNIINQRKNIPEKPGPETNDCPSCGSNMKALLSPTKYVCMECLTEYPKTLHYWW